MADDGIAAQKRRFAAHVRDLQDRITDRIRALDPDVALTEDLWTRTDHLGAEGGGGRTRVFRGPIIEGGGVNTSEVYGALSPGFARELGAGDGASLWATGISLILHPRNPNVPTVHANFRMIAIGDRQWFGGGADLTPYLPHTDDFRAFHRVWRDACDPLGTWTDWKARCDAYFTNHHRDGEMRGVGGIFFDHHHSGDLEADRSMVEALSERFIPSWFPIAEARVHQPWTPEDEAFQLWRRGRYVEFNLLHDRGTRFGLQTGGRTESILVSLPPRCTFAYDHHPAEGSPHAAMMRCYRPHDWTSDDDPR